MEFRAGSFQFQFPRPTLIMGILNVTPDSFSDGGCYLDTESAVERAYCMAQAGADIIDVGGESTRPGAEPVHPEEELRRVLPVIEKMKERISIPISIDTRKVKVAGQALKCGASIINDVEACREDDEMGRLVAGEGAGYIVMHMKGNPGTMQKAPVYDDVVDAVQKFFESCLDRLNHVGVSLNQIVLDVGIGFGKTLEHNLELLANLEIFKKNHRPLLLGVSRKSFMSKLLKVEVSERLPAGIACTCWAVQSGVEIIRTHDVAETMQAIRMLEAIGSQKSRSDECSRHC
jgi:dihydropteroate synthase